MLLTLNMSLGLYICVPVPELKRKGDLKNKPIVNVLFQTEKINGILLNFKIYIN